MPMQLADAGGWITLAILVLSVVGWLVNAVKGNDADGNPVPRKRAKPNRDLRSEIEVFLEELQQPQRAEPQRQQPQQPRPEPQRNRQQERQSKQRPPAAKQASQSDRNSRKSGTSGRQASASKPQQAARPNLTGTPEARALGAEVAASVEQNLSGGTVAAVPPLATRAPSTHPLVALLRQPEGIRQAIILNEILQRPKSRRSFGESPR